MKRFSPSPFLHRASALLVSAAALIPFAALSGCRTIGADGGPDMAYIRTPDTSRDAEPAVNSGTPLELLFPVGSSRRWDMAVTVVTQKQNDLGETEQKVVQRMTEQIRIGAPKAIGKVKDAIRLEMRKNGSSIPYREEAYQVDRYGIKLVAAGGNDKMVMSPPMPLLNMKEPQCQEFKWTGTILFQGAEAPARAYTRIGPQEKVVTPAGTFDAYRVDTSLTTIIEGRSVTFPASRWFAPGFGIVKQRFRVGNAQVIKELTAFKVG